jgi:hypothetical protein
MLTEWQIRIMKMRVVIRVGDGSSCCLDVHLDIDINSKALKDMVSTDSLFPDSVVSIDPLSVVSSCCHDD